jgi:general secretion pathway protein G
MQEPRQQLPRRKKAALFLIAVVAVVGLIATLAGVGLAFYTDKMTRASEATLKVNLQAMSDAIDLYFMEQRRYPPSLAALVQEGYMRAVPTDPFTDSTETWREERSTVDPGDPGATPGVRGVRSGSDRFAIDGTRYSDW